MFSRQYRQLVLNNKTAEVVSWAIAFLHITVPELDILGGGQLGLFGVVGLPAQPAVWSDARFQGADLDANWEDALTAYNPTANNLVLTTEFMFVWELLYAAIVKVERTYPFLVFLWPEKWQPSTSVLRYWNLCGSLPRMYWSKPQAWSNTIPFSVGSSRHITSLKRLAGLS